MNTFSSFFQAATDGSIPYGYQCRLACGPHADATKPDSLSSGADCKSQLINIPTGLGKTAAVVLAWLWNRIGHPNADHRAKWPRRLVYCLPMRTLVEQTEAEVKKWLENLHKSTELGLDAKSQEDLKWLVKHSPIILMGGEELDDQKGEWDIYPEKPAILIGTQDMLLSRALNRGYGMSRARWPMHFGLLNNDCLWVMDETQLMGVAVRTSAQLQGLRQKIGAATDVLTWWASATLDERLLNTPDHQEKVCGLVLENTDRWNADVSRRINAAKRLTALPLALIGDTAKEIKSYTEELAKTVLQKHQPTVTIVILNRVNRAKDLFGELGKQAKKQTLPERILIHSRFRPMEREKLSAKIKEAGEKIIVATQAIEAGVDISSRTLITELAPWSSLVQRFGRCNRKGEFNENGGADIFWINLEAEDQKNAVNLALPYVHEQLVAARKSLKQAEGTGVAPTELEKIGRNRPQELLPETHILRRKDLVELFDTTPDLAGLDIDVGRYIRDDHDRDVQAFWRKISEAEKLGDVEPLREELVRVSLGDFSRFLKANRTHIWCWNVLDGEWQRADRLSPGQIYLVDYELGGYSEKVGWTGEKSGAPFKVLSIKDQPKFQSPRDGQGRDDESLTQFQTIEEHTGQVIDACRKITDALPASAAWTKALLQTAQWHDVGKAHRCFQDFLVQKQKEIPARFGASFLAKAPWQPGKEYERPNFRHELASALAWLHEKLWDASFETNLTAYLIVAHHGKVRLSIRSMPGEIVPDTDDGGEVLFARGIWDRDELFPENSGKTLTLAGMTHGPIRLDLSCMKMGEQDGRPSWSARTLSLRDNPQLGVFRLAWLETLVRAADGRGSML